jgi:hypothetical protein
MDIVIMNVKIGDACMITTAAVGVQKDAIMMKCTIQHASQNAKLLIVVSINMLVRQIVLLSVLIACLVITNATMFVIIIIVTTTMEIVV